jgi:hypothetical protein
MNTLKAIRADCEKDAAELDGKPLDGKTVGETFGKVFAAIDALAGILIHKETFSR